MWPGLWVSREVPRPSIDQSDRYRSITRRLAVGARVARRLTSARCGWWAPPETCVLHPARQRQRRGDVYSSPSAIGFHPIAEASRPAIDRRLHRHPPPPPH